jgi:hypothetical protein
MGRRLAFGCGWVCVRFRGAFVEGGDEAEAMSIVFQRVEARLAPCLRIELMS